jgi:hypothetical protein
MSTGIGTVGLMQSLLGNDAMEGINNHEAFFLGALERDIQKHVGSKQLTYSYGDTAKRTSEGVVGPSGEKIIPTFTVILKGGELTESGKITNKMLVQGKVLVLTSVM